MKNELEKDVAVVVAYFNTLSRNPQVSTGDSQNPVQDFKPETSRIAHLTTTLDTDAVDALLTRCLSSLCMLYREKAFCNIQMALVTISACFSLSDVKISSGNIFETVA
jgi:hypothetical protein